MSINQWWTEKMWYFHTVEYYSVIKRNDVSIHATWWTLKTWFQGRKVSHTKAPTYHMIPFLWNVQNRHIPCHGLVIGCPKLVGMELGGMGSDCSWIQGFFGGNEDILKLTVLMASPLWLYQIPLIMFFNCMVWQSLPVFLPGESYGQRSLAGYSPWGCKESDTTVGGWGGGCGEFLGITFGPLEILNHMNTLLTQRLNF